MHSNNDLTDDLPVFTEPVVRCGPRKLASSDVEFRFTPMAEDIPPEESFDCGKVSRMIRKALENGDEAAWFMARVTATYGRWSASSYLGGCNYESFEDFKSDEYFEDMKKEALFELNLEIAAVYADLRPLFTEASP